MKQKSVTINIPECLLEHKNYDINSFLYGVRYQNVGLVLYLMDLGLTMTEINSALYGVFISNNR